jgi:hypothetical protein
MIQLQPIGVESVSADVVPLDDALAARGVDKPVGRF